ncbi:MAG TPA: hypothetical protein VL574_12170 [Stellaceae bacterium]|jgi:hypothetical protein|nr:hypothetical protein [Stellaceae bacterium]
MRRLAFLALALCLMLPAIAWAETAYVPGTEDVPLMPGLTARSDGPLIFDKPQGRIVEATATGAVKREQVLSFYRSSLPELGWHQKGEHDFDRSGERLSLDFKGHDGALTVGFTLSPR